MIASGRALRVVVLDPNANTPPYDRALCAALAAAGCAVELITAPFLYEDLPPPTGFHERRAFFRVGGLGRALRLDRRPAVRRALRLAEYPLDWAALLARLAVRRPDVLHVQWSLLPSLDPRFWRAARSLGLPIVYTVHNLLPHSVGRGDRARYRRLYHAADALIVHGDRAATALVDWFGVPRERITIAPHGPLLLGEPAVDRQAARRQLGLPATAPLVLFAGLIEPYKGLGDLVEAFARIASAHPEARLVIAGQPNEPFEPYRRALAGHGLLDRVHLNLRFLKQSELAAYLSAADVVALPYRRATTSGLLAAARRYGRPVVATDVGDLATAIEDLETGVLVRPGDPVALANGLRRLLADQDFAERLGAAGRQVGATSQSWSAAARQTMALYRSLLRCGEGR